MESNPVALWLRELNPALRLNEKGVCFIRDKNDQNIMLTAPPNDAGFYLYGRLVEQAIDAQLMRQALELNIFQEETRGGALAIDPRTQFLVLCFAQATEAFDAILFRNAIANFGETMTDLRARLHQTPRPVAAAEAAEAGNLPLYFRLC